MSKRKKRDAPSFSVGDKIVHPSHGAGVIRSIEQPDILDEFNRYYVIQLAASDMRVMVPVRNADELGLRKVMTKKKTAAILRLLREAADPLPDDFKARQAEIGGRLKEGGVDALAKVVRDMAVRSFVKTYSPTEARLYEQARTMLSGEMALSTEVEVLDALAKIDEILQAHVAAEIEEDTT